MSGTHILAVAVLAAAGCTAPDYGNGHLACAPNGACPSGFYCATDTHCWRDGSGPMIAGDDGGGDGGDDFAAPSPDDLAGIVIGDMASSPGVDLGGGPSTCGTSMALLCESFEGTLADNGWSPDVTTGNTAAIDTTHVFRGTHSLKTHIAAAAASTSPFANINTIKPFPIVSGTLYARVWVYFSPSLPALFDQFLNFSDAMMTGVSVATDSGDVTLNDYAGTLVYQKSNTALPLDRWACIQFQMPQNGTTMTGTVKISLDGSPVPMLTQTGTSTPITHMYLGMYFDNNSDAVPAYDAWFDELIVDNKPVGCDD